VDDFDYNDERKSALFEAIYLGFATLANLPGGLYTETAKVLKKALYKGYGGTLLKFQFGGSDHELLKELRDNIYIFSAAKTATQVAHMSELLGKGLSLAEFKKEALTIFGTYNQSYLETEYITAQTSGGSAANWNYVQEHKHLFTKLRSIAIIDSSTAPECERMNGVVANVDDPIWNHNLSPRHHRCRCHEEKIDKYDDDPVTPKSQREKIMAQNEESMRPEFKMNPGKDRYVFSPEHAYFDIGRKYKVLAKKNFNLKIPKTDGD
jgi:SPP1 gp7 family putative phage head morphogenesis protein